MTTTTPAPTIQAAGPSTGMPNDTVMVLMQLHRTTDAVGATWPAPLSEAEAASVATRVRALEMFREGQRARAAVIEAVSDGRDPFGQDITTRAVVIASIPLLLQGVYDRTDKAVATALRAHVDDILAAWATAIGKHATALTAVAAKYNIEDLDNAEAWLKRGGTAAADWGKARAAAAAIAEAISGWQQLLVYVGLAAVGTAAGRDASLLAVYDIRLDALTELAEAAPLRMTNTGKGTPVTKPWWRPWWAALHGHHIAMIASVAEYRQRVDAVAAVRSRRAAEVEAERSARGFQ